jgi:hypothetical protein
LLLASPRASDPAAPCTDAGRSGANLVRPGLLDR